MGAWWEELNKIDPERAPKPKADSLDELLSEYVNTSINHQRLMIKAIRAFAQNLSSI